MKERPLICTLTAADYRDRESAWLKLGPFVRSSAAVAGGLRISFTPAIGLRDSLTELVRLEAECCGWMTFAITDSPEAIQLSITSDSADGEQGIREAFAPLARG
ncbi:MAG TPA: hypothetical protein VF990_07885 [Candidatus Dormibacteraeota bacterium]